ncbi:MAG: oligosaccharide flippase family protein, partial [Thermomicrobiales bacterium]
PKTHPTRGRLTGRAVAGGVAWTLVSSSILMLSIAVGSILVVRMLGVTGRGEVAAAVLVPTIIAYGGWLGLPVATGYGVSSTPARRAVVIANARALALALSLGLGLLSLALSALVPLHESVRAASMLFALFIPLNLFHSVQQAVLQADMRTKAFNLIRIVGAVAYVAALIALDLFDAATPTTAVLAQLGASAIWVVLSSIVTPTRPWFAYDRATARELLAYGARAHLGSTSPVETLRLDQLILAVFLSTYDLGLYVIAMTFVTLNRVIGVSVGMVAFPVAAREAAANSRGRRAKILSRLIGGTLVLAALAAAVQILFGRQLLRILFDVTTDDAYTVLVILACGSVLMNLRQVSADVLRGLGRPGTPSLSELVSLATLCLCALLFWDDGLIGVAWAVTLSSLVALVFVLVVGFLRPPGVDRAARLFHRPSGWHAPARGASLVLIAVAVAGAAGVGAALVYLPLALAGGLVVAVAGCLIAVFVLHRWGTRGLSSAALAAAVVTLAWNGVRLGASVALSDLFFLLAALVLLPGLVVRGGQERLAPVRWLVGGALLIVVGGLLGSMFAANPSASLAQLIRFSIASILVPILFAFWSPSVVELRRIAWLWVCSVTVSALVAILEMGNFYHGRADGLTNHPNHLALTCVMATGPAIALTLLSRGLGRWIGVGCGLTLAAGLLISGSRAGLAGIGMTLIAMAAFTKRAEIAAGIAAAFFAGTGLIVTGVVNLPAGNALARLFGSEDRTVVQGVFASDEMRQDQFQQGLDRVLANPFTGVGFEDALASHDIYLQLWSSAGVLGLAGILTIAVVLLNVPARTLLARGALATPPPMMLLLGFGASFFGYLVTGLFHNALWDRYLWLTPALIAVLTPHAVAAVSALRTRRASSASAGPSRLRPGYWDEHGDFSPARRRQTAQP